MWILAAAAALLFLAMTWKRIVFFLKRALRMSLIVGIAVAALALAVLSVLDSFQGASLLAWSAAALVAIALAALIYKLSTRPERDAKHRRGGQIMDGAKLARLARKEDPQAEIFVGVVPVPCSLENRHFLLSGATGSGKSQAFYQIAAVARARGDAAIVADINAEMLSRFYSPERGDIILNPLDTRSAACSPLAEIEGPWDADQVSRSIIPDAGGDLKEWNHYAQVLLSAALLKIWQNGGTNYDLTHLVLHSLNEGLAEELAATSAAQLFAPGAERMLSSIRAILSTHCQPFSYLSPTAGRDGFSITKFIRDDASDGRGAWLFFPARDDFFKTIRSTVAGQIAIAISALLSTDDNEARRVWFFLDEFASWGKIDSIDALLTKARKKGGVGVLGLQSIAQLRDAYGREGSQVLLANLGTWLTLRAGDAETADYMSKNIGDEEVRRTNKSTNKDFDASFSEQIAVQRSVMPAELQNLTDLVGVLNIAGPLPAGWIKLPISPLKRVVPGFEIADRRAASPTATAPAARADTETDFVGELLDTKEADA